MFQNIEVQWKAKDPVRAGYRRSGKALGLQGNNRNKNNVRQPGSDGNDGLKGNNTVFNRFGGGSNRPGVDIFKEGAKLYSDPSLKKQGRAVQHPRQMKREPNIPTKRSLQQQQQSQISNSVRHQSPESSRKAIFHKRAVSIPEERWNCGVLCPDRDLLNQELDNEISKYRKNSWSKEPMNPEPTLMGADNRGKRITHEKLQPRARVSAQTNGPVINFEREQKMFYCPDESVIHSGKRQQYGNWDSKVISLDVYEQERARPHTTASEKRRVRSGYNIEIVSPPNQSINIVKPELSICRKN